MKGRRAGTNRTRASRTDPFSLVTLKSRWMLPRRMAFDVVLRDDVLAVWFSHLPERGEPWYVHYDSRRYGCRSMPLATVNGDEDAEPMAVAVSLCAAIGAPAPKRIRNLETNFVDMEVPELMKRGPLRVNYPFRPSGHMRTDACVLFADLRGSSSWNLQAEYEHVLVVANEMVNFVKRGVREYYCDYWKLLGDGLLMVWDAVEEGELRADHALAAAFDMHKHYWYLRRDASFDVPVGFGIAVTGGPVTKFWSKDWLDLLMIVDYVGPIVNQAARMQSVARPGQVLVDRRVRQASSDEWHVFGDVTRRQQADLRKAKGTRREERIYMAKHTQFGSTWKSFCTPNR